MPRRITDPRWGDAERARFGLAIALAGQGQQGCIEELVNTHKIAPVTQATVSRWISADIKTPDCIDALLAYSEAHAPATGIRVDAERREQDGGSRIPDSGAAGERWEMRLRNTVEVARLESRLHAERQRSARLAREIERLGSELARVLDEY